MRYLTLTLSLILGLATSINAQSAWPPAKIKYSYACSPFVEVAFDDAAFEGHKKYSKPFWLSLLENGDYIIEDGDRSKSYNREHFKKLSVNGDMRSNYAKDGNTILLVNEYYDQGDYIALVKFTGGRLEKVSRTICAN